MSAINVARSMVAIGTIHEREETAGCPALRESSSRRIPARRRHKVCLQRGIGGILAANRVTLREAGP